MAAEFPAQVTLPGRFTQNPNSPATEVDNRVVAVLAIVNLIGKGGQQEA